MVKKFLLALAAIPAATLAVEASAQSYYPNPNGVAIDPSLQLQSQLDAGVQAGTIDATEARRLRQEIRRLSRLQRQYSANGLTPQERDVLQQQAGTVSQQIQVADGRYGNSYGNTGYTSGNNGYGNSGYANGNPGYTTDQYGRRIPTPTYTTDRYGRPVQNGYYGQGAPAPVPAPNGGLGSVLGNVLGGGAGGNILASILGNGGLRVGDLITGTLGSVLRPAPNNFGSSNSSDNGTYFRSDGERVYEIDTRTNTVVRIHPVR